MNKRANESLNEIGELHRVCALIRIIAFEYKAHKHGILTPPTSLKHKTICKKAYMEMWHNTCNTQITSTEKHNSGIPKRAICGVPVVCHWYHASVVNTSMAYHRVRHWCGSLICGVPPWYATYVVSVAYHPVCHRWGWGAAVASVAYHTCTPLMIL